MDENLINLILVMLIVDIIILVVYVISPIVGEKAGFRWRKIMWLVLAIRLLIPVHLIQSALSLPTHTVVLKNIESDHGHVRNADGDVKTQKVSYEQSAGNDTNTNVWELPYSSRKSEKTFLKKMSSEWFYIIWGVGAILILVFRMIQFVGVKRYIRDTAKACKDTYMQERLPELCQKYNLEIVPDILVSKKIHTPMLWGYQKPELILPAKIFSIDEIELILSHELIHYKNKDLWYKLFLMILCDFYWFNPVLRIMQSAANRDMEYLCDEAVVQEKSLADKKTYAKVILQSVTKRKQKRIAFSTHFIEKETSVEERIENIFTNKKRWKSRISLGFFVLLVISSCCLRVSVKSEAAYGMQANHSMAIAGKWYPSEESVREVREVALEGMEEEDIERIRGFVIQMNMYWENKFLWQEAEKELSDPESEQWDSFMQSGKRVIGYEFDPEDYKKNETLKLSKKDFQEIFGKPVYGYDAHVADGMIATIEKTKQSAQNEAFKNDLTRLEEAICKAEETHDVNYVVEMYHIFHDMDYYLFRYGPGVYGDEVRDRSMLETYYGVLEVYEIFN